MQVELAQVEARVAGPGDAEDPVRVGLVVVAQAAGVVDDPDDLVDVGVEQPRVLGIGDHQPGRALGDRLADRVGLGVAVLAGIDGDHLVAGRRRARAVARVREDRRDDLVALGLAPGGVVGAHHARVRVHALRPAGRLEA